MHEVYENDLYIFLILELLRGGELFDKLKSRKLKYFYKYL